MKKTILILMLLIVPSVSALQGSMKLLAAYQTENGTYEGVPADLYLEIKKGAGRVFLDTYPLTKMDTQISTRFSKEIACSYLNINCDNYDFFYTIKADSIIIGGPSAGSAITLLTVSLLKNYKLKEDTAITGTINSGAIIGSVGSINAKIDSAKKAGIKKVLIPKGERFLKEDNKTVDLQKYASEFNIELKEVADLDEALQEFTGKQIIKENKTLSINPEYKKTMRYLAERLCNRSIFLKTKIEYKKLDKKVNNSINDALNLTEKGKKAFKSKRYYSSASYCFGANVKYSYAILYMENLSFEQKNKEIYSVKDKIKEFSEKIDSKEILTITDLESYSVVKERLKEADDYLNKAWLNVNSTKKTIFNLAYGKERLYSAYSWAFFFDNRGKRFDFKNDIIKDSCIKKISEAEERYQYLNILNPTILEDVRKEINFAKEDLRNKNYELCLFKASKAKASADAVLSIMGVDDERVNEILAQKLDTVKNIIAKQISNNVFPIVGYSYYEYANTLKDDDKYSALLFSEYALELSNLDMYFKEKKKIYIFNINYKLVYVFLTGLVTGILVSFILIKPKRKKRK